MSYKMMPILGLFVIASPICAQSDNRQLSNDANMLEQYSSKMLPPHISNSIVRYSIEEQVKGTKLISFYTAPVASSAKVCTDTMYITYLADDNNSSADTPSSTSRLSYSPNCLKNTDANFATIRPNNANTNTAVQSINYYLNNSIKLEPADFEKVMKSMPECDAMVCEGKPIAKLPYIDPSALIYVDVRKSDSLIAFKTNKRSTRTYIFIIPNKYEDRLTVRSYYVRAVPF